MKQKTFKVKRNKGIIYQLRRIRFNRNHNHSLFVKIFHDKKLLLQLYNAVNGSDYTNVDDLIITTLDDVVYMGYKNDCSFIIGTHLNLYEHQSTYCPNMPLRGFLYLADILQSFIEYNEYNIYGHKLIKLPTPQYIVFYNGTEDFPDKKELYLSDAFESDDSCLEFKAIMININLGHNKELMGKCRVLEEYATG